MFGPLPRLHRVTLVLAALALCIGAGAWLASWTPVPLVASVGAALGAAVGVAVAYLLTHDFAATREARPLRLPRD